MTLKINDSVEIASSKKIILTSPQKLSPSRFNKRKMEKQNKEDNFFDLDDIFSKIESFERNKRQNMLIKNYNWNGNTDLKINDTIISFKFLMKNSEKKDYEIFKKKGIIVVNGLLENENKFDIQSFDIKFEENQGMLTLKLEKIEFTFLFQALFVANPNHEFVIIHEKKKANFQLFIKPNEEGLLQKDNYLIAHYFYMY